MADQRFVGVDPSKDNAPISPKVFGIIFLLMGACGLAYGIKGIITDSVNPIMYIIPLAFGLIFGIMWVTMMISKTLRPERTYIIGDDEINAEPGIPSILDSDNRLTFKEVTGVIILKSAKGGLAMAPLNPNRKIWPCVTVNSAERMVLIETSKRTPTKMMCAYSFTPEDVDGFIAALKKRVGKGVAFTETGS